MTRRRVLILTLGLLLTAALATRAQALFGVGDIVFDPSVFAQAVEQVIRLERQYAQLVQSYQMLRSQYEQMLVNAQRVPVDMTRRYRALATPWSVPRASDLYGTTGAWTRAASTGLDVAHAFEGATESLGDYGAALAGLEPQAQRYVKTSYGTVELTDGVTQGTLETIGRLRSNSLAVQAALERLESDSLSGAPELNTEVGVLNKINAAGVIALRSSQDTNSLLVTLAEQQMIAAKRTRDAEARAINQHIRFLTEAPPALNRQSAGTSDAMRAWRMP
jgi:conjugal transfer/entry exclusion protein